MKLTFAATIVLTVAFFGSAAGAATTVTEHDEHRAALLRGVSASDEEHGRRLENVLNYDSCSYNSADCVSIGNDCVSGNCIFLGTTSRGVQYGRCMPDLQDVPNGRNCYSKSGPNCYSELGPEPNNEQCASGWCDVRAGKQFGVCAECLGYLNAGLCEALQCFTYDGLTNNIPVTQQCQEAGAPCCRNKNGMDACTYFVGKVCVTDSQPSCSGPASCFRAGIQGAVSIMPGSCNGDKSCALMEGTTVHSGSCGAFYACTGASAPSIPESRCNTWSACYGARVVP